MLEFYPEIKAVHVTAVIASGALFLLRGAAVAWGGGVAMIAPVRYLSYTIDTVLLMAAMSLLAILPSAVYGNGWLWAKMALLLAYIGFGTLALKRGRTAGIRRGSFVAAIASYACMYIVARTHDPLGPLTMLRALTG
ncbi:MAG: SirB2 family protein [Woeseiaceae bacterium]|nr:SirB2 family protein [Woeseiaceae bacterium]